MDALINLETLTEMETDEEIDDDDDNDGFPMRLKSKEPHSLSQVAILLRNMEEELFMFQEKALLLNMTKME